MKKSIIVIFFFFANVGLNAQESDSIRTPSDNVEVVKNYEAIIMQAQKKDIDIEPRKQSFTQVIYSYEQKSPKVIDFERPDPVIQALGYKESNRNDNDIKDGNVYGAYGNQNTISGGAAYHYYIEDWIEAGFKVDHFSAKNKNIAFQKFAKTYSNLYAGYYFNPQTKVKMDLNADFDRHYSDSLLIEDELITQQAFDNLGAELSFAHTSFEELGLSLRMKAGYNITKQLDDKAKENRVNTGLNVFKKLSDNISLEIPLSFNRYSFDPDTSSVSFNDLILTPGIRFKSKNFSGKVSALYVNGTDYSTLNPVIQIDVPALYYEIDLTLAAKADYQRNSLTYLSGINPFVISQSVSYTPSLTRSYLIKLKRNFDKLDAAIKVVYNDYDSVYNFRYNDPDQRFLLQTINRSEINVAAKLGYAISDHAHVSATILKRNFLNEIYPSYVPEWEARINTGLKTADQKLKAELELYFLGERPITDAEDPDTPGAKLNAFPDLSFNAEYSINKHFGIYIKAVNLFESSDSQLWYNHPVLGRQFWGGIRVNI